MLQHHVLLRYVKDVNDEHTEEFCRKMLALQTSVAGIEYLEIGRCPQLASDIDHALCFS